MEKSRTIHIINLSHYLENTPFAQDLLKHNMEMEPNMEWKIWTEKDPEIQEGIKSYTGPVSERYASLKAGIFLGIVACTFPASSSVPACKASSASFDMPLSTGVSFRRSNGT